MGSVQISKRNVERYDSAFRLGPASIWWFWPSIFRGRHSISWFWPSIFRGRRSIWWFCPYILCGRHSIWWFCACSFRGRRSIWWFCPCSFRGRCSMWWFCPCIFCCFPTFSRIFLFGCFLFLIKVLIKKVLENGFFQLFLGFSFLGAFFSNLNSNWKSIGNLLFSAFSRILLFGCFLFPIKLILFEKVLENCLFQLFLGFSFLAAFFF